ncbi:Protein GET1 [Hypsizygus marmoreus]|uniref:Protein GET1 n=1 Tax=Hypsizygus marmoreus TaxID=39966 RepID=A0A369J8K6_HYPMA|nr:Protein GET1 [Hypsizygus marmoreus]
MSLILTIFALVFVTQLISWIGQSVLLELAYALYLRLFHSSTDAQLRKLKIELLNTKSEMLQTSAQDHFAKWAKLRRSVDKGLADLEKLNSEVAAKKSAFSFKFNTAIWILTTGVQFFVGWWYRRSAVFYLPPGWFGPLGWWLSFPFAPAGSVSVGVWQMACKRVIKIGERVVKDLAASSHSMTEVQVEGQEDSKKDS